MRLSLNSIVPSALRGRPDISSSYLWQRDLTFNQGEAVLIQGPSGTGKTSFLRLLYGIEKDFGGMIHWSAFKMNEITDAQLSQLRASSISAVFQDLKLFEELTVWENVEVNRRMTNTVSEYDSEKWLDRLGLKQDQDIELRKLSLGERQRVAIVRALVQPFEWLLLDEPFCYLDHLNKSKAISLIKEVAGLTRAGIIMTSNTDNDDFVFDKKIML